MLWASSTWVFAWAVWAFLAKMSRIKTVFEMGLIKFLGLNSASKTKAHSYGNCYQGSDIIRLF